jgi:hypothetical protein
MAENWCALRFRCTMCDGTGVLPLAGEGSPACVGCDGTGYTASRLELDLSDLTTKINHIKTKVNSIWDKVNV